MIDDKVKISIEAQHSTNRLKAREIPGWFHDFGLFEKVTAFTVGQTTTTPVCVEIGSWMGRSVVGLVQAFLDAKATPVVYAIDTWEGTPSEPDHAKAIAQLAPGETLFNKFYDNVRRSACENYIFPIKRRSQQAALMFEQRSLDYCFIDGDHSFEMVTHDLNAFLPLMRPDRILAGHDYYWGEVHLAVNRFAKQHNFQIKTVGDSWWFVV